MEKYLSALIALLLPSAMSLRVVPLEDDPHQVTFEDKIGLILLKIQGDTLTALLAFRDSPIYVAGTYLEGIRTALVGALHIDDTTTLQIAFEKYSYEFYDRPNAVNFHAATFSLREEVKAPDAPKVEA